MSAQLKLTIELVPQTSWYSNLRKWIPRAEWDRIRKATYANHNNRCSICQTAGRLKCHEIWEYDDARQHQKPLGFTALCQMCHHVKHIGFAGILASRGQLDYNRVVNHFLAVNGCDLATFERHKAEAFQQWHERSRQQWTIDLGEYASIVKPPV